MSQLRRGTLAGVALVLLSSSLSAHHGYAAYNRDQVVTVEGTLVNMLYANPHVMLAIKTADSTVYVAEWQAANWVERVGVTKETFKIGDHLIVRGAPRIDPSEHRLALLKEVKRTSDGWDWTASGYRQP